MYIRSLADVNKPVNNIWSVSNRISFAFNYLSKIVSFKPIFLRVQFYYFFYICGLQSVQDEMNANAS